MRTVCIVFTCLIVIVITRKVETLWLLLITSKPYLGEYDVD